MIGFILHFPGEYRGSQFHAFPPIPDSGPQEQGPQVLFYGAWADIELGRDLFVATALDQQLQHLLVARSDFDVVKI